MTDLAVLVADALLEIDCDSRLPWHDDPAGFARECIDWPDGQRLTDYQAEMLTKLVEQHRVAVRGPHSLGKTTVSALALLWFAVTRDAAGIGWKVLSTAGAWRQLTEYLWPEVRLWAGRLRWDLIGREPFDTRSELMLTTLRLKHGQAFAGASDDPQLLEGAHAASLLAIFDEAKSIQAETWEALEGTQSGTGEAFALATSTPGTPTGTFYDIHARKAGFEDWYARHVTLDEAIAAGRISPTWIDARRRQWGEGSGVFQNRCLGEFASDDEDGVIPLSWIELANERWQAWRDSGEDPSPVTVVGVDVARSGTDQTVLALRARDVVTELRRYSHEDTMQTTGRVVAVLEANRPSVRAVVDVIGIGAGVVDRLREKGYTSTVGFNASGATSRKDRSRELGFTNSRSAAWWWLRERLDPTFDPVLALPPDDLLIGDLVAPKYAVTSAGKVQVESKDEIRKRLGRSTDSGDAVVMACFDNRSTGWQRLYADACSSCEQPFSTMLPRCPHCGEERVKPEPSGWGLVYKSTQEPPLERVMRAAMPHAWFGNGAR